MRSTLAWGAVTFGVGFVAFSSHAAAQPGESAASAIAAFAGNVEPGRVIVQFTRGASLRVVDGVLTSATMSLVGVPKGAWSRVHEVDDATLDAARMDAEKYWGRALPDLTQTFFLRLAPGVDLAGAIDALRARTDIVYALPSCNPVTPTLPPNYSASQRYSDGATNGIGANPVRSWPGGTGSGVKIVDLEYSWNTSHQDLPAVTRLGVAGVDPFSDNNHGTAVLGEVLSLNNGWGTTGAAYGAEGFIAPTNFASGYNLPGAITTASTGVSAGDVLLIEQQWGGPRGGSNYVPVEWFLPNYDAIRQAVGSGRIVVEAAGNGGQDLDDPIYSTGNGNHWPFLPQNDSGAIMVGAGAAPAAAGGSTTDRSRLGFSNYGATLDLQGWGERVYTTGYGDLYSVEGVNLRYTSSFSGTSSASPIVASACVLTQAIYRATTGQVLIPSQIRQALLWTGSPQQSGAHPASQRIGPRPNVPAAITFLFGGVDCNGNQIPDPVDIAAGVSQDRNQDGIPDECQPCAADFNADGFLDFFDYDDYVECFETTVCPTGRTADFNADGFVDFFDYDDFVVAFSEGC